MTFNTAGKAYIAVSISFYSPLNFLTNRKSLVTLKTLNTLAIYGPTAKNENT